MKPAAVAFSGEPAARRELRERGGPDQTLPVALEEVGHGEDELREQGERRGKMRPNGIVTFTIVQESLEHDVEPAARASWADQVAESPPEKPLEAAIP